MFDQMKNLMSLMGQARQIKEKMEQVQADLARRTVEGDAGAGAVRVVANGKLEIVSVTIDPAMMQALVGEARSEDVAMVAELIAGATNQALAKARDMVQAELSSVTGGLNLPGLSDMLR